MGKYKTRHRIVQRNAGPFFIESQYAKGGPWYEVANSRAYDVALMIAAVTLSGTDPRSLAGLLDLTMKDLVALEQPAEEE